MALPPKGDPQRPLKLAVRSTRVLGILFCALGMCGTLPMLYLGLARPAAGAGGGGGIARMAFVGLSTILVYFGPGALYLVCAVFIARRRTWAVITAMVLAAIQLLFITFGMVMFVIMFLSNAGTTPTYVMSFPLGIMLLVILALAQLEYHLSKCFEAIRLAPLDVQRGFEPLPPAPVIPVVSTPGNPDDSIPR